MIRVITEEGFWISHNRIYIVQGFGDADLQFRNFVVVVLFGGEVEGHGGPPDGVAHAFYGENRAPIKVPVRSLLSG